MNQRIKPLRKPLTPSQMRRLGKKGDGYIEGVIAVDLSDIIDNDLEGFLDLLSDALTGSTLLMDTNYSVVGHEDDTLFIKVSGDPSGIFDQ